MVGVHVLTSVWDDGWGVMLSMVPRWFGIYLGFDVLTDVWDTVGVQCSQWCPLVWDDGWGAMLSLVPH